jgi:hypothetical protein
LDPNEQPTTVETYSAEEALAEISRDSEESEETPAATADEGDTEETTESNDETEASELPDNEEEEDEATLPDLDTVILEAIGDNPDAVKRWNEQWKGLQKKETQLAEREQVISKDEDGYSVYQTYSEAFADPNKYEEALAFLTEQVRQMHGAKAVQEDEVVENENQTFTYDGQIFYSEREIELYKEIRDLKNSKREDPELEEIKAEVRARKAETALNKWVDQNLNSVAAKVKAKTAGWEVSRDMLAQVAKADGELLKTDPVQAFKRNFPDAYADFRAGSKPKPKVRDLVDNSSAKGYNVPDDPREYSAKHALMEIDN